MPRQKGTFIHEIHKAVMPEVYDFLRTKTPAQQAAHFMVAVERLQAQEIPKEFLRINVLIEDTMPKHELHAFASAAIQEYVRTETATTATICELFNGKQLKSGLSEQVGDPSPQSQLTNPKEPDAFTKPANIPALSKLPPILHKKDPFQES
jgi:hypothetical protein